jgi:hypothetical protein
VKILREEFSAKIRFQIFRGKIYRRVFAENSTLKAQVYRAGMADHHQLAARFYQVETTGTHRQLKPL